MRCLSAEGGSGNPRKKVSEQINTFTRAFRESGRRLSVNEIRAEAHKHRPWHHDHVHATPRVTACAPRSSTCAAPRASAWATRSSNCDAKRAAPRATAWAQRYSICEAQRAPPPTIARPPPPPPPPPSCEAALVVNSEPRTGACTSVRLCGGPGLARFVHM